MKTPDLDKAFPKTPSYVHRCVLAAFEEGERRADRRKRRLTAFCCAAAMLLVFIAGGFAVSSKLLSSPDSILPPLSAASASPQLTPTSTPDPAADGMEWYDPGTVYAVSAVRLYVDNQDECYGQTDAESCTALSDILKATLTAQTELTAYMSASFTPPLVLEIDYTERDARAETGTTCVRLNWNSGLNLFYTNGQSWALENGCDELFSAMNVDTNALAAALTQAQTVTQAPTPQLTDATAVMPEPTAAPTNNASDESNYAAEITPSATPESMTGTALEGDPFAPEDIHDLTRMCLYIGDAPYCETDDPDTLATMEKLLSGAEAIQGGTSCPYGPVLYLTRADGVTGYIEPAYDSCAKFRAGETTYDYSADGGDDIWSLIGVATDELIDLMTYYGKDMVFVVPGSSYYHVSDGCEALSYEMSAYSLLSGTNDGEHLDGSIIRERADLDGQTPCAYCAQTVYATKTGMWYHTDPECSGMEGADEYTISAAQIEGKTSCPICMDGTTNVLEERALVFLVPADMGGADCYHGDASCSVFRLELASAQRDQSTVFSLSDLCLSAEEAAKKGASPCTYCTEKSVYATPNGTWYHTDSTCSGMMNARAYTVMQAQNEGKTACPVCCDTEIGVSNSYQSKIQNKNTHIVTTPTSEPQNESSTDEDMSGAGAAVG